MEFLAERAKIKYELKQEELRMWKEQKGWRERKCDLSQKNIPQDIRACGCMHGMQTDETGIDHTACTDEIARVKS